MNNARELRGKTQAELENELMELRKNQMEARIQQSMGQFANVARFSEYRKDIARIKTVLNEMERK